MSSSAPNTLLVLLQALEWLSTSWPIVEMLFALLGQLSAKKQLYLRQLAELDCCDVVHMQLMVAILHKICCIMADDSGQDQGSFTQVKQHQLTCMAVWQNYFLVFKC